MIDVLLGEIGRRLTDRWLTRALGPGLLWCAVAAFAVLPGRSGLLDVRGAVLALAQVIDDLKDRISLAVICALLLVAVAVVVALVAQTLGAGARFVWLGRWPGPAARLAGVLADRRRAAAERRLTAQRRVLPAVYLPARPTWIADRIRLADDRVAAQYGLRLGLIWPRLWLLLAPEARADVTQARDRLDRAGIMAGWAVLHAALVAWWWPAILLGTALGALSWWRGRAAAGLFADVVEATVDLRHRALAAELGFPVGEGRTLTAADADAINDLLHKGASGHTQEARDTAPIEATPSSDRESRERQQPDPERVGSNTTLT